MDDLIPATIGRGVAGDEGFAHPSEVVQPELNGVQTEHVRAFVQVRLNRPGDLRRADPTHGAARSRVREDSPRDDP